MMRKHPTAKLSPSIFSLPFVSTSPSSVNHDPPSNHPPSITLHLPPSITFHLPPSITVHLPRLPPARYTLVMYHHRVTTMLSQHLVEQSDAGSQILLLTKSSIQPFSLATSFYLYFIIISQRPLRHSRGPCGRGDGGFTHSILTRSLLFTTLHFFLSLSISSLSLLQSFISIRCPAGGGCEGSSPFHHAHSVPLIISQSPSSPPSLLKSLIYRLPLTRQPLTLPSLL